MNRYVILLDEDRDDWSLVQETLSELGMEIPLKFFPSSIELFNFLPAAAKPSLILIDYNALPDNGLETLRRLKGDASWRDIPVVVLSETSDDRYKKECYANGANSFIRKPSSLEGTREKIGTFFKYWFDVAEA